ncbi:MAG: c-type cytochrome, partial [Planctomycetaceae bacterium]|nr:c-type cytochrome [Planctomycetaceae bacterium]
RLTLSPHAKGGLSESARRGQALFHSEKTRCATCHSGPWYTDSGTRRDGKFLMHDVGTGKDDPSELMEPRYDTPTLLGLYRSAPYLHHGKAATLRDVLTSQNKDDQHGTTSSLNDQEIDDLVEFLKALPFELPDTSGQ